MADISKELNQIKNAVYGREVRGSIHDGIDKVNKESEGSRQIANNTERRQDAVEQQFDDVLNEWTGDKPVSNEETIAARTNRETGENHQTLGQRLDAENKKVTEQLAETIEDVGDIPLFKAQGNNIIEKLINEFTDRAVNIKWWHHLIEGNDWTNAIEAAIDFINNQPWEGFKVLFFPPGQYRITRPVYLLNPRFMILGANRHNTIIKLNSVSYIKIGDEENPVARFNIKNIRIQSTNINDSGTRALILDHATEGEIDNTSIDNFNNGVGIEIRDRCWTLKFTNARLTDNDVGVLFTGNDINAVSFSKGMINRNRIGVYLNCDRETHKVVGLKLIDGIQMERNSKAAIQINSGRIWGMHVDGYFEINHPNNESRLLIARVDEPEGEDGHLKRFVVYNFTLKNSYIWHRDTQKTPFLVDTRNGDSVFRGTVENTTIRNAKLDYGLVRCIGSSSIVLVKDCLLIREDGQVSYSAVFNEQGGGAKVLETLNSSQTMFRSTGDMRMRGGNLQLEQGGKLLADGGIGVNNHQRISDAQTGWIYGKFPLYDFDGNFLGNVITYRDND